MIWTRTRYSRTRYGLENGELVARVFAAGRGAYEVSVRKRWHDFESAGTFTNEREAKEAAEAAYRKETR
jgi:hypothetical protein